MEKLITLLSQRRIWSALFGAVALLLTISGYTDFDANAATDAVLKVVDALSIMASMGLAIHSYFFPKTK